MPITRRIAYLADYPEVLPRLRQAFETEWPCYYGPEGPGDAGSDLQRYCHHRALPIGLVAFCDGELGGVAVLKADSIATPRSLGPWAAAGWVSPAYRRRGLGAALLRALEALARDMGYPYLYCGSRTATRWLQRQGWQWLESVDAGGEVIDLILESALTAGQNRISGAWTRPSRDRRAVALAAAPVSPTAKASPRRVSVPAHALGCLNVPLRHQGHSTGPRRREHGGRA